MPPFEKEINRKLIVSKIAELLYQLRIVPESTEIADIQFGNLFGPSGDQLTKMKVFPTKGVKVISFNAAA